MPSSTYPRFVRDGFAYATGLPAASAVKRKSTNVLRNWHVRASDWIAVLTAWKHWKFAGSTPLIWYICSAFRPTPPVDVRSPAACS